MADCRSLVLMVLSCALRDGRRREDDRAASPLSTPQARFRYPAAITDSSQVIKSLVS